MKEAPHQSHFSLARDTFFGTHNQIINYNALKVKNYGNFKNTTTINQKIHKIIETLNFLSQKV